MPTRIIKWFREIKIPLLGNESGILFLLYAEKMGLLDTGMLGEWQNSPYHRDTVDIAQKFTHIGILRKNAQFSSFNMLPDVIYVIVLIKHLTLQLGFRC